MSRELARGLKQSMKAAKDEAEVRAAALALLRHSLRLGHRRLSLKRLEDAVSSGVELTADDLHRCAELALAVNDARVHERLVKVSRQLMSVPPASAGQ